MGKISIVAAGLLLGSGLVSGCGSSGDGGSAGSGGGDYCDTLKAAATSIKSFTADDATPDFSKLPDFIAKAHELADNAPSDVKDDWTVMVGAMDSLTSALDEAGIKLEDFGTIVSSGQLPEGVDPAKLTALTAKLQELGGDEVTKAGDAISKQAKDDCKVDLSKVG
jgi:hypothetical protein